MRFLLFIAFLLFTISIGMVWKRWEDRPPVPIPSAHSSPYALVGLPNGSTMMAERGTVTRALVDWLEDTTPGSKSFELGGEEFIGRTANPTP